MVHYLGVVLLGFVLLLFFLALIFLFPPLFFFLQLSLSLELGPSFVEIGVHPAVFLAAQLSVLYDVDPRDLKVTCV